MQNDNQSNNITKTTSTDLQTATKPQNNQTNNSKTLTHEQYLKYQYEAIALLKEYKTLAIIVS